MSDGQQIAETILAQLGGNRFLAMTGAHTLTHDANSLRFKLPRGASNGANYVVIALDPTDTYSMTFYRYRKLELTKLSAASVYAEDLRRVFTDATGLDCTL